MFGAPPICHPSHVHKSTLPPPPGAAEDTAATDAYIARKAYLDADVVADYERDQFSGRMGHYWYRREQSGVASVAEMLPPAVTVLDCPCGTGRWWPVLSRRATSIHGVDISPAMLAAARGRADGLALPVTLAEGDAEHLGFDDGSFDVVFSHALTKHLPIPVQYRVLNEFARVATSWVVCSFSLVERASYEIWRRRAFADSFPLLPEQLRDMAGDAGLVQVGRRQCRAPLGVGVSVLFRKTSGRAASTV